MKLFVVSISILVTMSEAEVISGGAAEVSVDGRLKEAHPSTAVHQQDNDSILKAYEELNKWKECLNDDSPKTKELVRYVFKHNLSRAAGTGFPTRLQVGEQLGLTQHETAAIFGWTTGDYRLLNPIARGESLADFDDYPFVPQELTKLRFRLHATDVQPYIEVLKTALSKLPSLPDSQCRLWRGHARSLGSTTPGSIVRLPGFSSVTRDRDTAISFATKDGSQSRQRSVLCILDHFSAKSLSKLSARSNEYEVLFPADRTFQVVEPPTDESDHREAVELAVRTVQQSHRECEIQLLYLKEVGRPSFSDNVQQE